MNRTANERNEEMAGWLKELGEGSVDSFDKLYAQVVPWLLPMAKQLLGDPMEAEDVCHDVLLAVIGRPERYDPTRGSVEAWLAIQLRSRCLDRLRKRSKIVLTEEAEPEAGFVRPFQPQPEETVMRRMQGEAVRLALRQLPGMQREALAEAYYSSRSQRELADSWQVPLGTVKSRMRYGLLHLKESLVKMGWADADRRGGDA